MINRLFQRFIKTTDQKSIHPLGKFIINHLLKHKDTNMTTFASAITAMIVHELAQICHKRSYYN